MLICRTSALKTGKAAVILEEDSIVFGNQWEMGAFVKNFLLNQQNPCDPENCGSNRWLMFLFMSASQQENNRRMCLNEQKEDVSLKVPVTWEMGADKPGGTIPVIERISYLLHKKTCSGVCEGRKVCLP